MKSGTTSIVTLMLAVGLAASLVAQVPKPFERSATSSVETSFDKDGSLIVTTVNRKFSFTEFSPQNKFADEQRTTLLLLEEFTSKKVFGAEQSTSSIKVEGWFSKDANPSTKTWTINQVGDVGERQSRFYKVTKYGCCMTPSTDVYFSLITGQRLFTSTKSLSEIVVPNTSIDLNRYVAYLSRDNSFNELEGENGIVGILQYGSETGVISTVAIRSSIAADDFLLSVKLLYQKKLTDTELLMLWATDGKNLKASLSGFSIVLSYDWAGDIVIPVSNDSLDLIAATVSKKFTVSSATGIPVQR